ncbi:HAMP domain-containing protein [Petralouisia muris]|jgi:sigma-B regulation protein RsbU (phosphoserine phosphatase)|uniref:HAMP domain-containing protein n=1 Tax=Petralouisia muris TaxID=3032872 RepID=A0AC61S0D0_9FIRM|nr:PP2C family protein-serine/threonine phosphatase [Petralouisia muris]TGY97476.1 HAMP domain-containing protein [Petralouisia muris]
MKKRITGLTGKLTLGIIIFGILLGAIISIIGYREFTSVLEQQYNDSAYEIAETAARYLNPDKFEEYLSTGKVDGEYREIEKRLDDLVDATGTTLVYVAKVDTSDYRTLTYIYDSVNSASGFDRYPLGYTAIGVAEEYVNNVRNIITKGERATEYLYSYSEESGAHTTAGIAIYDSKGEIVAILGVEKAMKRLENARNTYVKDVLLGVLAAVCLFLLVYSMFLYREILLPILAVTDEAKRFADSNTPSDKLSAIKKNDEIGVLAKAVEKMERDIVEYVENLTMVTAEKERIGAELSIATQIQADMLPGIFPAFPEKTEFDIYATMNPAKEVGGDFYDFFMVDESHLAIVMADVSGKGVPAALFMVIGKTLIKDHTQPGKDLGEVFTKVNDLLCESNSEGLFITAFEGVLDLVSGEFTFVNAGHEIPFICKKDGSYEPYKIRAGFVLAGMEGIRYKCGTMQLSPGDRLFQYTDGVTEATDKDGRLYGMARLGDILARNAALPPMELLGKIKEDIDAFVGDAPQFDDITMLCLEYRERMHNEGIDN